MVENPFQILLAKLTKIESLLATMNTRVEKQGISFEPKSEYLTVKQLSDLIHLKESTIYSLVHQHRIPVSRQQGRRLIFSREEISKWVESGRQKTMDEIKQSVSKNLK